MNNVIFIDYHKCVGCGTCEMICSMVHEGICSSLLSRIRIVRDQVNGYNVPITCALCEKAPCINICPVKAINKDSGTGAITIQDSKCIGCRQCVQACPFGHMNFNFNKGVAFKCDLCEGDPQCVKFCWTNAINYIPVELAIGTKRFEVASRIVEYENA